MSSATNGFAASKAEPIPDALKERPFTERLELYLTRCVGRDMTLKTLVYTLRLITLHCGTNTALLTKLQVLILNIIDCRMLTNQWKYIGTFRSCVKTLSDDDTKPTATMIKAFTALSFFFRSFEQFAGDLSYVQKNWLTQEWSRARISWHYKFNKTMSLTANAIVEVIKILVLQAKIQKLRREMRDPVKHRRSNSGSADSFISSPCSGMAPKSPVVPDLDRCHASSPVAPEAGVTPANTPNGKHCLFPATQLTPLPPAVDMPTAANSAAAATKSSNTNVDIAELRHQRNRCILFLLRNLCDMVVYFQWVTWYKPYFHLQYLCGFFSGAVGVKLVWEDTSALPKTIGGV